MRNECCWNAGLRVNRNRADGGAVSRFFVSVDTTSLVLSYFSSRDLHADCGDRSTGGFCNAVSAFGGPRTVRFWGDVLQWEVSISVEDAAPILSIIALPTTAEDPCCHDLAVQATPPERRQARSGMPKSELDGC